MSRLSLPPNALRDDVVTAGLAALDAGGDNPDQAIRGDVVQAGMRALEEPGWSAPRRIGTALAQSVLQGASAYAVPQALQNPGTAGGIALIERGKEYLGQSPQLNEFAATVGALENEPWYNQLLGGIGATVMNPVGALEIAAQSLPAYAMTAGPTTLAGAAGGPIGMAAGAGVGSFWLDASSTFLDSFKEQGVDVKDPAQLFTAINNRDVVTKAAQAAVTRGVPVAIFDALSAGVAGRLAGPVKGLLKSASKASQGVAAQAAEYGTQAVLGGSGEAAGQLAQGKPVNTFDVLAEAVGEVASAPFEMAMNAPRDIAQRLTPTPTPTPPNAPTQPTPAPATAPTVPTVPQATPPAADVKPADADDWLVKWVQANPDMAIQLAAGNASRRQFQDAGFPKLNTTPTERTQFRDRVKALLTPQPAPTPTAPTPLAPAPSGVAADAADSATPTLPDATGTPPSDATQTILPEMGTTPTPAAPNGAMSLEERAQEILDNGEADTMEDALQQAQMELQAAQRQPRKEVPDGNPTQAPQAQVPQVPQAQVLSEPSAAGTTSDVSPTEPAAGSPMRLYHGSAEIQRRKSFSGFDPRISPAGLDREPNIGADSIGIWLTPSPKDAAFWGKSIRTEGGYQEGAIVSTTATPRNVRTFANITEYSSWIKAKAKAQGKQRFNMDTGPVRSELQQAGYDFIRIIAGGTGDSTPDGADIWIALDPQSLQNTSVKYAEDTAPTPSPAAATPEPTPSEPTPAPPAAPAAGDSETPDVRLSRVIQAAMHYRPDGTPITRDELYKLADKAYGGTRAEGAYGPSDVDDAMEAAVHRLLVDATNPSSDDTDATLRFLNQVESALPTQRNRSGEKTDFQQFSTPPSYAFAANWIANIQPTDTVLEPSAGTGGLLIHAKNAGATTIANEITARRASLLATFEPDTLLMEDAEHIDAHLKTNDIERPSVVVMNPPFSRAAHRTGGKMDLHAGSRHVMAALKAVKTGGRVVAIVGGGMDPTKVTYKPFFDQLAKTYQLRANVLVSGDVYTKYGTSFDSRVLVIDKMPPDAAKPTLRGKADTIPDLITLLREVRNDRPDVVEPAGPTQQSRPAPTPSDATAPTPSDVQPGGRAGGQAPQPGREDAGGSDAPGGRGARPAGEGNQRPAPPTGASGDNLDGRPGNDGAVQPGGVQPAAGPADGRPTADGGSRGGADGSVRGGERPDRGGSDTLGQPLQQPAETAPESVRAADQRVAEPKAPSPIQTIREPGVTDTAQIVGSLNDVFTTYTPSVRFQNTKPHRAALVESVAMRSVDVPKVAYQPAIDPAILASGDLSDAQLESVALIGQAHQTLLPNGARRGAMNGDGTGVGKGRIIAGVAVDNFNQGRKLTVWITKNEDLANEAHLHYRDVGGDPKKVTLFKPRMKLPSEGVVVLTYGQLGRKSDGNDPVTGKPIPTNLEHLLKELGPDFDGPLLMDEAHVLEGADRQGGDKGRAAKATNNSAIGRAAVVVQESLPQARVAYFTATSASEPGKLGWATRLGLWGKGTAFPTFTRFADTAKKSGTAFLEALALEMKTRGLYQARTIALNDGTDKGSVKVERIDVALDPRQKAIYNQLATQWRRVLTTMTEAAETIAAGDPKKADAIKSSSNKSQLFGAQQRFFSTLITSFKVPRLIKEIEADLAKGESAVIQLTRTYGSATEDAIDNRDESVPLEELDLSPIDQLVDLIRTIFPIHRVDKFTGPDGKDEYRVVTDAAGNPIVDQEALNLRESLIADIQKVKIMPRSPIDMIIDHFGQDMVAEITGRKVRVVKGEKKEQRRGKAARRVDREGFAEGTKRVLIFSEAGGTGVGYHADRKIANQQHRNHYLLDPGWKSTTAIQGLGRTHRTNQASAPTWKLIATDIPGEKRFISTIARRLEQMGAITRGTRKGAGTGIFKASDNLESPIARETVRAMMLAAAKADLKSIDTETLEKELGLKLRNKNGGVVEDLPSTEQVLNRMMMLNLDNQDKLYAELADNLEQRTEAARAAGRLDVGIEEFKADGVTPIATQTVYTDEETGGTTNLVSFEFRERVYPQSFGDLMKVLAELPDNQGNTVRFVKGKKSGKVRALVDAKTSRFDVDRGLVERYREFRPEGIDNRYLDKDLVTKDSYVDLDKGAALDAWNAAVAAMPEHKTKKLRLATGLLLPIWNELGANIKILRVTSDDGQIFLGRRLGEQDVERLLRARGITDTGPKSTPIDLANTVLAGTKIKLNNGLSLERRTVGGEVRLEVVGVASFDVAIMTKAGAFVEKVGGFNTRVFIPIKDGKATEKTGEVLAEILRYAPVAGPSVPTVAESDDDDAAYIANRPIAKPAPSSTHPTAAPRQITPEWIVRWMEQRFDVPMRYGRVRKVNAAGIFKKKSEVIRIRGDHWGNLYVHTHEVAHHLDKSMGSKNEFWTKKIPQHLRTELGTIDYEPAKKRAHEGFAEYIARRFVNHEDMSASVPQFDDYFNTVILPANPTLALDLHALQQHVRGYQSQTPLAKVQGQISDDGRPTRMRPETILGGVGQWIKETASALNKGMIEAGAALQAFDREAGSWSYDLFREVRRAHMRWGMDAFQAGAFLTSDPGNIMGPSVRDLMATLASPKDFDDAVTYTVAAHALDMKKQGVESGIATADARAVVQQFANRPDFKAFHEVLSQMNDALLDVLVDAGEISQGAANRARAMWGDRYIPMFRVKQLDAGMQEALGPSAINPFRSRSGSSAPIVNPVAATLWKYMAVYQLAGRGMVRNAVLDAAKAKDGLGDFVEPDPSGNRTIKFSPEEIRSQLEMAGLDPDAMDDVDPDAMLAIFRPDTVADRRDPLLVRRYEGENVKQYRLSPELAQALASISSPAQATGFTRVLVMIGRLVTRGVRLGSTTFNDAFIIKNLMRDAQTYAVQGEGNLLERLVAIPLEYLRGGAYLATAGKADPVRALYTRMRAGEGSVALGYRPGATEIKNAALPPSLARTMLTMVGTPKGIVEANEFVESMPRLAAFRHVLAKREFTADALRSGKVPPLQVLVEASNAAADATVDFSKRGAWSDYNAFFLFGNAIVQSNARTARNFSSVAAFKKAAPGLALLMLAGFGQWWMLKDEDWYKAAEWWAKGNNWLYAPGGTPQLRIPFAQEMAAWVIGPMTRVLDAAYRKDASVAGAVWDSLYGGIKAQVPSAPLLQIPIEYFANYDFFRDRPIENQALRNREPMDRFNASTTLAARAMGKAAGAVVDGGASPAMIEHLLDSASGGLFRRMVRPLERLATGEKGTLRDWPFISGITFARDPNGDESRFYDLRERTRQKLASARDKNAATPELEEQAHSLERVGEIMEEVRKQTREVRDRDDRFVTERYMIGLARRATGQVDLAKYPDPIKYPATNPIVRKAVDAAIGRDVEAITAPVPKKEKHESVEHFQKRQATWQRNRDRSLSVLQDSGYTREDLERLLRDRAKAAGNNTRATDERGNWTAFGDRLRRLRMLIPQRDDRPQSAPGQ